MVLAYNIYSESKRIIASFEHKQDRDRCFELLNDEGNGGLTR